MSETELKALAYDELARIENSQNNIKIINEELLSRVKQKEANVEPEENKIIKNKK